MMVDTYLRTRDLAQAAHISVQQVRNYEASGFIPPAERRSSGYRLYTQKHLAALKTGRSLLAGFGWERARKMMQAIHRGQLPEALAIIDERHAELTRRRLQIEHTLSALSALAAQPVPLPHARSALHGRRIRVGEAAKQVGVRVSALRFWEQQGLLLPERDKSSHYRLYDEHQMRRLRVVALLREAGYDFTAIRTALDELASGQLEKALAAVDKRRAEIARISWACLAAMPSFQEYLSVYWGQMVEALLVK